MFGVKETRTPMPHAHIALYLDPRTSEVSDEFDSMTAALAAAPSACAGAQLLSRGVLLATVLEDGTGWTLTTWGDDRLADETKAQAAA